MELTEDDIQPQLSRRRPGQSALTTPRDEKDRVQIQSGTEFGITLGTPIGLIVRNEDQRPKDYGGGSMDRFPRPSHADWTYLEKYGVKASSGGGRSSARETIGRVAAGAIAEKYLSLAHGITITAFVTSVGSIHLFPPTAGHPYPSSNPAFLSLLETIDRPTVDSFAPVRCPDPIAAERMAEAIAAYRDRKDSIGGTVTCVIKNIPTGLGEPAFDKLEAMLAHAMLSIPATKGFEIGSGFGGCEIPGSIHNDPFIQAPSPSGPRLITKTNNSGGIQGGITNGSPIYFRTAFKPPATIGQAQCTALYGGDEDVLEAKGRHDPCVVPRAVPIVEAMAALVVMDALLAQQARQMARSLLPPLTEREVAGGGRQKAEKGEGSDNIGVVCGVDQGRVDAALNPQIILSIYSRLRWQIIKAAAADPKAVEGLGEEDVEAQLQQKNFRECITARSIHYLVNSEKANVNGESRVQKTEDELLKSYITNKPATEIFAHRPTYGTKGNPITLLANYFEVVLSKDLVLYRYNVEILPDASGKTPVGGKLKRIFQLLIERHFGELRDDIATDFKCTLICKSRLSISNEPLSVQYLAEKEDEPPSYSPTYKLRLLDTGSLSASELMDYLTSTKVSSVYGGKEEIIQSLNIILGHHPKKSSGILSVGSNRHYSLDRSSSERYGLGVGLEAIRGYFVSARVAAARVLVNVQVNHVACFESHTLDRLMANYLATNIHEPRKLENLEKYLRGMRVTVTHIVRKNKAGQEIPRIKTIFGLARKIDGHKLQHPPRMPNSGAGPKDVKFYLDPMKSLTEGVNKLGGSSGGGGKGKEPSGKAGGLLGKKSGPGLPDNYISVFDFFRKSYNRPINNSELPVINVGNRENPIYLPAEVCAIVDGQPSKTKLTADQTAKMIQFAVRKPAQNVSSISIKGAKVLGIEPQNATLKKFGISIEPQLITVPGRVLTGPAVRYKGSKTVTARSGSWNMQSIQFTSGTSLPSWTYLLIKFRGSNDAWGNEYGKLKTTLQDLHASLGRTGVTASVPVLPGLVIEVEPDGSDHEWKIDDALGKIAARGIKLALVILPKPMTAVYNRVKYVGDVLRGVHTVCVVGQKLAKQTLDKNAQYFANVALKFNLKLGGTNQSLDPPRLGIISEGKTMVVGIDVTHPSPGSASSAPSVAGIVASVDAKLGQWPADIRIQASRQEMVSALDDLLKHRLQAWRTKNKRLPDNLLVYRDGVSEGQYSKVLEEELPLLRKACATTYPGEDTKRGLPNITIIVVGKRHHTRFYPTSEKDADRSSNPQNGTIVDRGVTEPRNWDFFLQAHTAIQGTARPAHYFIVMDEIFRKQKGKSPFQSSADALEDLTHNMCYLFGRATKAVSVCPPAYYADLVCERARCYLSKVFDATPAPSISSAAPKQQVNPNDVVIHRNLKDSMFYI
ncbi:MAG: hypothetical protein M1840_006052 [Geoglossum simile]|nr:MAG: hypothetical protein M1840_006052 [Geoglossum simile]